MIIRRSPQSVLIALVLSGMLCLYVAVYCQYIRTTFSSERERVASVQGQEFMVSEKVTIIAFDTGHGFNLFFYPAARIDALLVHGRLLCIQEDDLNPITPR